MVCCINKIIKTFKVLTYLEWSKISQRGKTTNFVFLFPVNVWVVYCVFHWQVKRGKDVYDHWCPSMTLSYVCSWERDLFLTWVFLCETGAPQAALTGRASWLASRLDTFGFTLRCVSQLGRTEELLAWTPGFFLPSLRKGAEMFMLLILSLLEWSTSSCTAFEWRSCPTAKVQNLWNSQASWCHRTGFVRLFQKRSASVMGYGRESSLWILCVLYQFLMGWTIP